MVWSAGSVVGNLGLDISGFTGEMLKAQGLAELMPRWVTDFMVSPLLGMADVAKEASEAVTESLKGIIESVKSLGEMISESGNRAADISLLAEKAGVATQFFSEWAEVAKRVNVSTEQLGNGFKFLQRAAAETVSGEGGKKLTDAFEEVGLSAATLKEHLGDPQWLFLAVRHGLDAIPEAAKRTQAAMEILSRGGQELLSLFKLPDLKVNQIVDDAHRTGMVVDEEAGRQGRAWLELQSTFNEVWDGMRENMARPFLDYITQHGPAIKDQLLDISAAVANFASDPAVQELVKDLVELGATLTSDTARLVEFTGAAAEAAAEATDAGGASAGLYTLWNDLTGGMFDNAGKDAVVAEQEHNALEAKAADEINKARADKNPNKTFADLETAIHDQEQLAFLSAQTVSLREQFTGHPLPPTDAWVQTAASEASTRDALYADRKKVTAELDTSLGQSIVDSVNRVVDQVQSALGVPAAPAGRTAPAAETPTAEADPLIQRADDALNAANDILAQHASAAAGAAAPAATTPPPPPATAGESPAPDASAAGASLKDLEARRDALVAARVEASAAELAAERTGESREQEIAQLQKILELSRQLVIVDDQLSQLASDKDAWWRLASVLPSGSADAFNADHDSLIHLQEALNAALVVSSPAPQHQPAAPAAEVQPDLTERHAEALRSQVEELTGHIREQRGDHDHGPADRAELLELTEALQRLSGPAASAAGTPADAFTAGINELVQGIGHALGSVLQSSPALALAGGAAAAGSGVGSSFAGGAGIGRATAGATMRVDVFMNGLDSEKTANQIAVAIAPKIKAELDRHSKTMQRKAIDQFNRQTSIMGEQ